MTQRDLMYYYPFPLSGNILQKGSTHDQGTDIDTDKIFNVCITTRILSIALLWPHLPPFPHLYLYPWQPLIRSPFL